MEANKDLSSAGNMTVGDMLPAVGDVLGTNTVLHLEEATTPTSGTTFEIDLNNVQVRGNSDTELSITIGGLTVTVTKGTLAMSATTSTMSATDAATKLAAALKAQTYTDANGNTFTFTSVAGTNAGEIYVSANSGKLEFEQTKVPTASDKVLTAPTTVSVKITDGSFGTVTGNGQDYNPAVTNIKQVTLDDPARLASTSFKMTADMVGDGATLTIADKTYTFTADAAKKSATDTIYVGDLDLSTDKGLSKAISRLTEKATDNDYFSVGYNGNTVTLVEKDGKITYTDTDLAYDFRTKEGLAKALKYQGIAKSGKSLVLQIGDTSDEYNQLSVSINDIHTKSLGIDDVDISTQEGAQTAIDAIKTAINTVSSTRGDLGAVQNRLEHTANNLSVMTENIQDAESTIRDTDIAEEMMSYTKNSILVQSAQAMLAQANTVPQGVLQLLQ
jgi:flagellin